MRNKQKHPGILVLTACMSLAVLSTGCRSGKSNMFSFRSEPSPEALAGNGPTTTYPVPPSESATPEAIASVAGGTGAPTTPVTAPASPASRTAQVAGLDVTPGYVTPASTNMSAAQANGFHGGTKPVGFQSKSTTPPAMDGILPPEPAAPKTTNSGYQFGTNPAANRSGASSYTIPSSFTPPSAKTSGSAPSAVTNAGGGSGFTLPSDLAGAVTPAAATTAACTDCDGCKACEGTSTASLPPVVTPTTPSGESYSPGSTAGGSSYPTGGSTYLR